MGGCPTGPTHGLLRARFPDSYGRKRVEPSDCRTRAQRQGKSADRKVAERLTTFVGRGACTGGGADRALLRVVVSAEDDAGRQRVSCSLVHAQAPRSPRTSYAVIGRPKPFNSMSPTGAASTCSSTAPKTRCPISVW